MGEREERRGACVLASCMGVSVGEQDDIRGFDGLLVRDSEEQQQQQIIIIVNKPSFRSGSGSGSGLRPGTRTHGGTAYTTQPSF